MITIKTECSPIKASNKNLVIKQLRTIPSLDDPKPLTGAQLAGTTSEKVTNPNDLTGLTFCIRFKYKILHWDTGVIIIGNYSVHADLSQLLQLR